MDKRYCEVCGREGKTYKGLCEKHSEQKKLYGVVLDDNSRCKTDPNEIIKYDKHAEIILYDDMQEEVKEKAIIDIEDVDLVKDIRWDKKTKCVVAKILNKEIPLQNYILNTDEKVSFVSKDAFDCRKNNMYLVKNAKKRKSNYIISKKNKNKVAVEFVGKSNKQVTASSIMVSYPIGNDKYERLLVEFGQSQGGKNLYEEYVDNKEIVQNVTSYDNIKATFVLHTHIDHVGLLPSLVSNHINIPIITTHDNRELLEPLLLDGSYIMDRNVKALNKKKYKIEPLYTESDVYLTMNNIVEKATNEVHVLNDRVSYKFINSGHILGSCQLVLYIKTLSGNIKKIHITSDLGSDYNKAPFVQDKEIVTSSTVSIFEATYNNFDRGFKSKKEVEKERIKLINLIKEELNKNKRILIGCFAQGRSQNMQIFLYEAFKDDPTFDIPIYVDGKLCLQINNAYQNILKDKEKDYFREVLSWKNFIYINDYEKSLNVALNRDKKIILSGGGMFTQGRILNHLKTMVEDRDSTIITVGYCGEGTIGREIQRDDNKTIKIEGLEYKKKCKVYQMRTWSSHIMAEENIKYMSQVRTPLIIIHHSDDGKYEFRNKAEEELRKKNNSAKVVCADDDNSIFYI